MTHGWNVSDLATDTRSVRARGRIPEPHRLLEHLLRNGSVTEDEARTVSRVRRFGDALRRLSDDGVVVNELPEACLDRHGRPGTSTRYWLKSVPSGRLAEHDEWYGR